MAASSDHNASANSAAHVPQAGTHTRQNMLTIVERPIGNAPRNIACTGWNMTALIVLGYMVYRIILSMQPAMKRKTLRAKITIEIHRSQ